jgi:hypothetical protein
VKVKFSKDVEILKISNWNPGNENLYKSHTKLDDSLETESSNQVVVIEKSDKDIEKRTKKCEQNIQEF